MTNPKGSFTRAAAMPVADKKWRVIVLAGFVLLFVTLLATSIFIVTTLYANRGVGNGNRVVSCATLKAVAPQLRLPECAEK